MQTVAHLLPPAYVFQGMRAVLAHRPFYAGSLALGGAIALLDILLAGYFFARVFRHAVRTGLLARYSAESTG